MAAVDYGALAWKNGKPFGKREDLFEPVINTLGFEPKGIDFIYDGESMTYHPDGYIVIGNKDIVFDFYKCTVGINYYKENKHEGILCQAYNNDHRLSRKLSRKYRKIKYEFFGYEFTIKAITGSVFLFESIIDGDKYEVLFGYGIDPEWNKYHIPEIYRYNKKVLKFLCNHDNINYKFNNNYCHKHGW